MRLNSTSNRFRIEADCPDSSLLERAAGIIGSGAAAVVPTLGVYGLAADALNPEAVEKIFLLKTRPRSKPLSVLAGSMEQVQQVAGCLDSFTLGLMDELWPGGVTFVVPAGGSVPPALVAGGTTVGVRLVAHPVTAALLKLTGRPVTGTSANVSGRPAVSRIDDLDPDLASKVEIILDAGPLAGLAPSTVVAVEKGRVRIIRTGRVPRARIMEAARKLG